MAPEPSFIGPYQLFQPLGAGSMGEVHLARSPGSRLVALKVIRAEHADDHGFRQRFRREVEAARRVSGFFTPPVLDADADGPRPWLATAYVPALSLGEVVRRFGVLPEPALRALGAGLAEALIAIHAAGLVHRDLKPANVLVASDGPRVIDFGISKALDATQMTRTGGTVGTPGYLSPEQILSGREVGPAADVFSFGCVLVFAAVGVNPFGTGGPADLYFRVVNDNPRLEGLPDSLLSLTAACLDKDPARRPTVEALLNALAPADPAALLAPGLQYELQRRSQEAAAILSRPYVAPQPTKPSRRRFLGIAAAVGVGVVAASASAVIIASELGKPETAAAGKPETTSPAIPPGPAPSWSQNAPTAFSNGRLALLGGTVVWFDDKTALGFDAATGSPLWTGKPTLPADARYPKWLGARGGVLYGTATDHESNTNLLYGLDAKGNQVADVALGPATETIDGYIHSTTFDALLGVSGGIAVIGISAPGGYAVLAIDIAGRKELWTHKVDGSSFSAVADGHRCYIQNNTETLAVDLTTGATLWSTPNTVLSGSYATPVLSGNALILTTVKVLALDPATGKQLWTAVNESTFLTGPAVTDHRIFVADGQETIFGVDPATGKEIWHTQSQLTLSPGGSGSTTPRPSASDSVLALPLMGPKSGVLVLKATDGKVLWAHQGTPAASGRQSEWTAMAVGSTVYAASDSTLHAFQSGAS